MRFRFLFSGGENILYGIKPTGELLWFRHTEDEFDWVHTLDTPHATTPRLNWHPNTGHQVGSGWDEFLNVFEGSDGVLYAVDQYGDLFWYKHLGRDDGSPAWANAGIRLRVGEGWGHFLHVFSGSPGAIYAVDRDGRLLWYRHEGYVDGSVRWANSGTGVVVGNGWAEFSDVFADESGGIYAVHPLGNLYWYKHLGHRDGSPRWEHEGRRASVSFSGADFTHMFCDERGMLYALRVREWAELLLFKRRTDSADPGVFDNETVIGIDFECAHLEGYCWPLSRRPGEIIEFYLSAQRDAAVVITFDKLLAMEYERGTATMAFATTHTKHQRSGSNAEGCTWSPSISFTIPQEWSSGLYAARCISETGARFDIPFVVKSRNDVRAPLMVIVNVNTWNAYNPWGGGSNYTRIGEDKMLSFRRPNFLASMYGQRDHPNGNHLARAELWILKWLREAGYHVDLYSDIDFHNGVERQEDYKGIILSAHPEYWSLEMMDRLQAYLNGGGHLFYLGGNGVFRQVEYTRDLGAFQHISNRKLRDVPHFPERELLGVQFPEPDPIGPYDLQPYTVLLPSHPFLDGTGLHARDPIGESGRNGAASGWEVDSSGDPDRSRPLGSRENPFVIASGVHRDGLQTPKNMIHFTHAGGGSVFSVGSINFAGSLVDDPKLQRILKNALDACLGARSVYTPHRARRRRRS